MSCSSLFGNVQLKSGIIWFIKILCFKDDWIFIQNIYSQTTQLYLLVYLQKSGLYRHTVKNMQFNNKPGL